jgi:hypothetical protein
VRAPHPSVPLPPVLPVPVVPDDPGAEPVDRTNRAARRGRRAVVGRPDHGHGAAPHARGAQGRRVFPVRRTG